MTLAEALLYQREQDEAKRPFYGNPNLAAQGRNANIAERSRAFPFMQAADAQFAKEKSSLSDPRAATDLINKGFIAGLGGAPVDLINMGLTPLGMGSAFPFGGSEHIKRAMEDYGVATPTERPIMEGIASLTPPKAVMGAARVAGQGAEAVGRAAAPVAGQALENYMVRTGGILPMDTWHGTPHRFPPTANNPLGEFDPMKIGTGEGAQAYGHGLYLAENPSVAESYKAPKAMGNLMMMINDKANILSQKAFAQSGGDRAGAIALLKELEVRLPFEQRKETLDAIRGINNGSFSTNLYKVDLPDEQIAKMLDWDKPLSQQVDLGQKISPESLGLTYKQLENGNHAFVNSEGKVLGNLQKNGSKESFIKNWIENVLRGSGRDLYNQLGQGMGGGAKVSEALRQAGIPGIRYLDQGSRTVAQPTYPGGFKISPPNTTVSGKWMVKGNDYNSKGMHFNSEAEAQKHLDKMFPDFVLPKTPQGTSNFVVFDPAHMNIIGRE